MGVKALHDVSEKKGRGRKPGGARNLTPAQAIILSAMQKFQRGQNGKTEAARPADAENQSKRTMKQGLPKF